MRDFGLKNAVIARAIDPITNPSRLLSPQRECSISSNKEKLPRWSFCALHGRRRGSAGRESPNQSPFASRTSAWPMSMISSSAGRNRSLRRSSRGLPIALPRTPKQGSRESRTGPNRNPKSQETRDQTALSCKIDYFPSAHSLLPAPLSEFFTGDTRDRAAAAESAPEPLRPRAYMGPQFLANSHFPQGHFEEAAHCAADAAGRRPDSFSAHGILACSLAELPSPLTLNIMFKMIDNEFLITYYAFNEISN